MRMTKPIATAAAAVLLATPGLAQPDWTMLGKREVNDRVDRDVISVPGSRRFGQVRLCAYDHAVRIYDVDVRFRNGGNQDVKVRALLQPGSCTRNIALKGPRRNISSVSFSYEAASLGRSKAHVRLFGR
jgi:hypothetical protein